MNLLQCWFNELSLKIERLLWKTILLSLALTMAGQWALAFETGRRLLNPVESLEGVPWPPDPGQEPQAVVPKIPPSLLFKGEDGENVGLPGLANQGQ